MHSFLQLIKQHTLQALAVMSTIFTSFLSQDLSWNFRQVWTEHQIRPNQLINYLHLGIYGKTKLDRLFKY